MNFIGKIASGFRKKRYWDEILLFFITLSIYVHNLSPSVFGGDSGDLITAAMVKGVAHPSGYPLHTMLGILFLKIPIEANPAWKVGLISSLFSAISVVIVYKIVFKLTKRRLLSILSATTLAFTYTFWLYAEIAEVFALNSFFILIIVYLTIKYLQESNRRILYLISFFMALSLTNNISIILLFPAVVIAIIFHDRKKLMSAKTLLLSLFSFSLGLLPYLYIPWAAKQYPAMNWGYAVNFDNFIYLVTRRYYGWGTETVAERFTIAHSLQRFSDYGQYLNSYFHPLILPLAAAGLFYLFWRKKYRLLAFFSLSYLLIGPFYLIYTSSEYLSFLKAAVFEKFYIAGFLILIILMPFGVILSVNLILKLPLSKYLRTILTKLTLAVFFLIPAVSLLINFNRTDLHDVFIGDNLGYDVLANLPENSVLLLRNDSLAFNTLYYQNVIGFRNDVEIPGPTNGFDILTKTFVDTNDLSKFKLEKQGILDQENLNSSIPRLMKTHHVYIDGFYNYTDSEYGRILTVPFGLLYKFEYYDKLPYPKADYVKNVETITSSYHLSEFEKYDEVMESSLVYADIQKLYSVAMFNIGNYLIKQYNDNSLPLDYLIKSFKLDPIPLK